MFKKKDDAIPVNEKNASVQEWFPLADVRGRTMIRKDGMLVMALMIACKNHSLYSADEIDGEARDVASALAGQDRQSTILLMHKSIDSAAALAEIDEAIARYDALLRDDPDSPSAPGWRIRRQIALDCFRRDAADEVFFGTKTERMAYILMSEPSGAGAEENLSDRIEDMQKRLASATFEAHICTDAELEELVMLYFEQDQVSGNQPQEHIHAAYLNKEISYV